VRLDGFPGTDPIYVDASIFIYTLLQHPRFLAPCQRFLEKVERGAVHALTSPLVLDEVAYKIIVERLKAILQQPLAPLVLERIKQDPALLAHVKPELELFLWVVRHYRGLRIVSVPARSGSQLAAVILKERLLPRDALHVLVMRAKRVHHIATNDPDFERVAGIQVWRP